MSFIPIDGCTAAATVAYAMSEAAYIFPITPSSPMAELVSSYESEGRTNIFGERVLVRQMQSEAGAAGALHGATSVGTLATTFTSSQGLLLMIPTLHKLSGELLPCVLHIGARTVATAALSIFGDHSDVYAIRSCGCALLCSASVKEAVHMAIVAHAASLTASIPFCHFMDGFRTTHEVQTVPELPGPDVLREFINEKALTAFRARGLSPGHPIQRGTAQNPDMHFQAVEANNPYYGERVAECCEEAFVRVEAVFGAKYAAFEYYGDPQATDVLVLMGSASEVAIAVAARQRGVGVVRVRLYRPFSATRFVAVLPKTVRRLCVLDRGKDPQAVGEPLFEDVCAALRAQPPACPLERVVGGRYGLSSKDFTPGMCAAVLRNLGEAPDAMKAGFTVGIEDDVTHKSLPYREGAELLPPGVRQCLVWGLGGDGTVGANKAAIKLVVNASNGVGKEKGSGAAGRVYGQGYFAYDANKSGGLTVSHLRFGPEPFEAPYGVLRCDYLACHHASYVRRFAGVLSPLRRGGTFVLNCPWKTLAELEAELPRGVRRDIAARGARFYVIDATEIAMEAGLGPYVNMVLQTVFFALSGVVNPPDRAVALLKDSVAHMYGSKGPDIVARNIRAIDTACDPQRLVEVVYPTEKWASNEDSNSSSNGGHNNCSDDGDGNALKYPEDLEEFKNAVFDPLSRYEGDKVPVSKVPAGGEVPHTGTSQLGKRGVAAVVPHWRGSDCVQCNQCAFVCPHAVIRPYVLDTSEQAGLRADPAASAQLETVPLRGHDEYRFAIGVSSLDCTGCGVCAETCPAKCLDMVPLTTEHPANAPRIRYLHDAVRPKPDYQHLFSQKQQQEACLTPQSVGLRPPLLEFPGSCPGCGETPLVRLLTQMAGERMCVASATGCNSIWGGSYPCVPYTRNSRGEGPAWHNSLFEDAAELGYGMATGHRCRRERLARQIEGIITRNGNGNKDNSAQTPLSNKLAALLSEWLRCRMDYAKSRELRDKIVAQVASEGNECDAQVRGIVEAQESRDLLARTSFWVLGGDGWAYDIGFGGLDHLAASGEDVNVLVMDTEVYSNTGGQRSKATPLGAQAKFCAGGKDTPKKDLGRMLMGYEGVYVASIAQGANMAHCLKVLAEAEAYPGPSVVIAYTPCIEHHIVGGMRNSVRVQKLAVETGFWLLYRFNPALAARGENPFALDSRPPTRDLREYLKTQGRYVALEREAPEEAKRLQAELEQQLKTRFLRYQRFKELYEPLKSGDNDAESKSKGGVITSCIHCHPEMFQKKEVKVENNDAESKSKDGVITSCIHCHPEMFQKQSSSSEKPPNGNEVSQLPTKVQKYNSDPSDKQSDQPHGVWIKNTPSSLFCTIPNLLSEEEKARHSLEARDRARASKSSHVEVCEDVYWIGAVDANVRDFHGIETQQGSTYNAYLIMGPSPTVIDTVKAPFTETFLASLQKLIDPVLIRYVVVNHAEPDHSSALPALLAVCPHAEVLCNAKCAAALQRLHPSAYASWHVRVVRSESTAVLLGPGQTLWFMDTPMVHWPESMYTYLEESRCLFCIDSFGQHIACTQRFDDELVDNCGGSDVAVAPCAVVHPTLCDLIERARSYYANILTPFGGPITAALNRLVAHLTKGRKVELPRVLATAHGVAWRRHVSLIMGLYRQWASTPRIGGPVVCSSNAPCHCLLPKVVVLYDTMYGATERMAREVARGAADAKAVPVVLKAALEKTTRTVDELFDAACVALGSPTLNNGCLPALAMHMTFVKGLQFKNRKGVAFGSYGWNTMGQKALSGFLKEAGIEEVCQPISAQFTPSEDVLKKCYEAGVMLGKIARGEEEEK